MTDGFRSFAGMTKESSSRPGTNMSFRESMSAAEPLPRDFYARKTEAVAMDLLGKHLVHKRAGKVRVGRIVEVEAYLGPHDAASHSARGMTPRNRPMFGPPGHAYVYLIYGIHHCMNVVTEAEGYGAAVLLRALAPVSGIDGRTSGPGLLCREMGIDRRLNGCDLCGETLFITEEDGPPFAVVRRPRIGVGYAGRWAKRRLRFYIQGSLHVSRK